MCDGCDPARRVCPKCKQFLDEAVGARSEERFARMEREVNELWESIRNLRGV